MSVTQSDMLERSMLEGKDREQLVAIASALGVKTAARATKNTIIDKILVTTGSGDAGPTSSNGDAARPTKAPARGRAKASAASAPSTEPTLDLGDPEPVSVEDRTPPAAVSASPVAESRAAESPVAESPAVPEIVLGADGEPLADWEIELSRSGDASDEPAPAPATSNGEGRRDRQQVQSNQQRDRNRDQNQNRDQNRDQNHDRSQGRDQPRDAAADGDGRDGRRRRRRNRNRNGRGIEPQGEDLETFVSQPYEAAASNEPTAAQGYLDLRDEGYGYLRLNGFLPGKDDAYISVKQSKQYGLRKGDFVTGTMRLAGRNEKNASLLSVEAINGKDPEALRGRPRFEDLTPLFPDEKLRLESALDPNNMTARIIDLICPIGKGQRGLIVSPPKAGKTTIMKTIAQSIERNNPDVKLMVLLIDERPEEVTDFRRTVSGEVIASTFDRPSDEHTHLAELAIEKAKRLVELGQDVVIILDGITRLSRAYNLAAPASGRIMSGGIDAGALYPPKKFFGAARNIEEGGSLTILATALVDTNSRMDDAIFEEFKGTGNMELRLDRKISERRIFPAIDVDASSTRHEELLFDRKQLQMVWKLRRVLSGLAAEGSAAPGLELLMDRLKTFRTNDEFLNEIAKQPSM